MVLANELLKHLCAFLLADSLNGVHSTPCSDVTVSMKGSKATRI